jgi:hypothetical protein
MVKKINLSQHISSGFVFGTERPKDPDNIVHQVVESVTTRDGVTHYLREEQEGDNCKVLDEVLTPKKISLCLR